MENITNIITHNSTMLLDAKVFGILTACLYIALFILGLIGNGLVIFVAGYKMKTSVNSIWFLNLAIADFIFIISPILFIIPYFGGHLINDFICRVLRFVSRINLFASIFFLTVISLDRCLCTWVIVWVKNKRTIVKARIICMFVWISSIGCSLPFALITIDVNLNIKVLKLLVIFSFIVGFLIPFVIIAFSHIAIAVRVKQLKIKKRLRAFRVIAVILSFLVCWLPWHVLQIYIIAKNMWFESASFVFLVCIVIAEHLIFINSCLNPVLYMFMCEEYKQKIKQSLLLVLESAFAEDQLTSRVKKQTKATSFPAPNRCQDETSL